ncbi:MAG: sigma-70 family RNA polymerase sigma factor [Ideonella sp.]|nr:sigma-70 family RNA polymerase sigma factor [Ideonella sp.]
MSIDWRALLAKVGRTLVRRGALVEEADDLVQEAWLRMDRYQQRQPVENPEAFMMATATHLFIDGRRARARRHEEVLTDDMVIVDPAPNLEQVVFGRERIARLAACIPRLPNPARDIFVASRIQGMTYAQIAAERGLSVSSIEKYVASATLQVVTWMEGD